MRDRRAIPKSVLGPQITEADGISILLVCCALRCSGKNTQKASEDAAMSDLKQLLDEHAKAVSDAAQHGGPPPDPMERIHLENAIAALEEDKRHQRSARLQKARVVGITTAACGFEIMQDKKHGLRYPIVLLDEASQQTEPSSLIPLNFKAERLLAVGGQCGLLSSIEACDVVDV